MEFYQMPMFNKMLVKDIEKAEKWYEKTLGFKSVFNDPVCDNIDCEPCRNLEQLWKEEFKKRKWKWK